VKQPEPAKQSETRLAEPPAQLNGATTEQLHTHVAAALAEIDPELLSLFLRNRKVCQDGLIQSIPDDYAQKILAQPERFRDRVAKFQKEPF
jgi:hypothetical protein